MTKENENQISGNDKDILRKLAGKIAFLASRPIEQEKRNLWYAHNSLQPTRPLIFCDPENGWNEIIPQDSLLCQNSLARQLEFLLRREIFWGEHLKDDKVIEPKFYVWHVCQESDWGLKEVVHHGDSGGSYSWDAPMKSYDDMDKLRFPELSIDFDATQRNLELAKEIFGGILEVRLHSGWWWSLGLTQIAVKLRGLEQLMFDMLDKPKGVHRLMGFLRDGLLAKIGYLEQNNLLFLNNEGIYVGSGGFGWTKELPQPDFNGKVRARDIWGFVESQETVGVSPDMYEEFIFPYELPILQRFGLNCYGCCEPLDKRWHIVKQAPNLRRISVSPWADVSKMAEYLTDRYIMSFKPNPSPLAGKSFDDESASSDIGKAVTAAGGCILEIIMKDCHTIRKDPNRVIRWVELARKQTEKFS